jgi:hypothetical protein
MSRPGRAMNVLALPAAVDAESDRRLAEAARASAQPFRKARTKIDPMWRRRVRNVLEPRASTPKVSAKRKHRGRCGSDRGSRNASVRHSAVPNEIVAALLAATVHFAGNPQRAENSAARALDARQRVAARVPLQQDVPSSGHGRSGESGASVLARAASPLSAAVREARAAEIVHFAGSQQRAASSEARVLDVHRGARVRVYLPVVVLSSPPRKDGANAHSEGNLRGAVNFEARAPAVLRHVVAAVRRSVDVRSSVLAKAARSVPSAESRLREQRSVASGRIVQRRAVIAKKAVLDETVGLAQRVPSPKSRVDFARTSGRVPIVQFGIGKHRGRRNL